MLRPTGSPEFDPYADFIDMSSSSTPLIRPDVQIEIDTSSTPPPSRGRDSGTPLISAYMYTPSSTVTTSLSVNYTPVKFSQSILLPNQGPHWRGKKGKGARSFDAPKFGGGINAFRSDEARIGHGYDDDDVGIYHRPKRWTKFKWVLFIANMLLTGYSIVALIACLLIWFNISPHSQVIFTVNRPELVTSTLGASFGILACVVGWAGIMLNNRAFLAIYTFLLWFVFAGIVTPGYISYRRRAFNLEAKLDNQWSHLYSSDRLLIQDDLDCCGYFSTYVEATVSATCYSRSVLPGCKMNFLLFERQFLKGLYSVSFALVPVHLFVMVAGLLCSNHVTYRFGKGMMPKAYRLDMNTVAAIMDDYASKLAEVYGSEVAGDIWRRSQALSRTSMPGSATTSSISSRRSPHYLKARHDSLNSTG